MSEVERIIERMNGMEQERARARVIAKYKRAKAKARKEQNRKMVIKIIKYTIIAICATYLCMCLLDIVTLRLDTRGPIPIFKGAEIILRLGRALQAAVWAFINTLKA